MPSARARSPIMEGSIASLYGAPSRSSTVDLTGPTQPPRRAPVAHEVIDLSSDSEPEADTATSTVAISTGVIRQAANDEGNPRLAFLKCVVCLDDPTDLTATSCGHLFCHLCIIQSLRASAVNARTAHSANGNCPVCRKSITVKSLLPLQILKRPRPSGNAPAQETEPVGAMSESSSRRVLRSRSPGEGRAQRHSKRRTPLKT